jgi:membrane protein YqaA with SNARE-associated domain
MDGMLWQLVWINLITPNFPFIFQTRAAITAAAVETHPWWLVLFIANLCGGLGYYPIYALTRWLIKVPWHQRVERNIGLRWIRDRWQSVQILVRIWTWLFPPSRNSFHQQLKRNKKFRRLRYRTRRSMFLTQILLNGTGLPDFICSWLAGYQRYPFWKLLLAQIIGRSFHNVPIVFTGVLLGRFAWFSGLVTIMRHPLVVVITTAAMILWWTLETRRDSVRQNNAQAVD